ncbi:hypothetical protein [Acidovorax sp. BL-A-41-H1]|uniref:hypothetical protein n=1 Tax=Acidovorax sp. BL-A-41-H1 TaxID=3421102 RepID=UPI003F7A6BC9
MHTYRATPRLLLAAAGLLLATAGHAQAPGEDPVVLTRNPTVQMQPIGPAAQPGQLDPAMEMPSWLRARVARYEARAFAQDAQGQLGDTDVVTTASAQGMQKTCVQEVGSNTVAAGAAGASKYGPGGTPQVVVLRGDLVNICR